MKTWVSRITSRYIIFLISNWSTKTIYRM